MKKNVVKYFIALFFVIKIALFFLQRPTDQEKKDAPVLNVIYTIEKFEALNEYLDHVGKDTLVILDVDYTLLQPFNPAFQQGNFHLNPELIKECMKSIPDSMKSVFTTSIAISGEGQLLEEKTPSIVKAFKQKGARILIISGILTGQLPHIPNLMDWRISHLKKLGIETSTFGFDQAYQFQDLSSHQGEHPEIKEGVILTNGDQIKKHQVLEAFFKKIKWQPKKVIFVDDSHLLVEQMADYMKQKKSPLLVVYTRELNKPNLVPYSKRILNMSGTI